MARARIEVAIEGAGTITVAATSTAVVAASTRNNRHCIDITNDSDTTIYLALGEAAVVNKGIRLNANGGSWTSNANSVWQGTVNAISAVASKKLVYVEY